MTLKNNFFFTVVACAAVLAESAWGGPSYTFTKLTPSGGSVDIFGGGGINNNGVLVETVGGQVFTYGVNTNAYAYYSLPGFNSLAGIDNSNNIAYTSYTPADGDYHGAVYNTSNSAVTTFEDPNATQYTFATSISSNGKIGGYYDDQFFNQLGFTRIGNTFSDVTFPGSGQKYVFGINNSGDVIGLSSCCRSGSNYLLKSGVYTVIRDPLGAGNNGVMYGMNDQDQVVGWYDDGLGGPLHGMVWDSGLSSTLDYPGSDRTILHGINDSGTIFGGAHDSSGNFLFVATLQAEGAPEPGTLAMIGVALLLVGLHMRRVTMRD